MKSLPLRSIHLVVLVLLSCGGSSLLSQTQAAPLVIPATTPSASQDPTQPEVQPRLEVDRDPIPSPDAEYSASVNTNSPHSANGPVNTPTPSAPGKPAELQKLPNGMYTLHADVDEVLLSCSVIDGKGRSIDDLKQSASEIGPVIERLDDGHAILEFLERDANLMQEHQGPLNSHPFSG